MEISQTRGVARRVRKGPGRLSGTCPASLTPLGMGGRWTLPPTDLVRGMRLLDYRTGIAKAPVPHRQAGMLLSSLAGGGPVRRLDDGDDRDQRTATKKRAAAVMRKGAQFLGG
jgi:hypothetical protein